MKRYIKSKVVDVLSEPEDIQKLALRSADTDDVILDRLADNSEYRHSVISHPNVGKKTLKRYSKYYKKETRQRVAQQATAPASVLRKMITDKDLTTRYTAIGNKNMDVETLTELSTSSDWRTREAVAKNLSTPVEILETLAKDPHWVVQRAVASNMNTPMECLEQLTKAKNPYVVKEAEQTKRYRVRMERDLAARNENSAGG
jgi:hypothetical protein